MPQPQADVDGASTDLPRTPGSTPAGPRSLPLSAAERDSLVRAGALAVDATGCEVLMGLSVEQSLTYLAFLRRPTEAPADRTEHQALTLQLERARLRRAAEAPERDGSTTLKAAIHDA